MSFVPVLPESAPFSAEQRAWLNGFFAGLFSRAGAGSASNFKSEISNSAPTLQPLTILYGSQTGTAEALAKKAAKEAGKRGFAPAVVDMAQTDAAKLAAEKNVLVITSTYGDGEPPDNAKALHTALKNGAPSLAGLRYAVCGLGDTNYTLFNQCGKDFDTALEKHGATRVVDRTDCDTDYEAKFESWLNSALAALGSAAGAETPNAKAQTLNSGVAEHSSLAIGHSSLPEPAQTEPYSKKNPFPAPVVSIRRLSGPGSAKEINHVEFSLEGSGLTYTAGDALGVVPHNCPQLVDDVLAALGCDGEEAVATPLGELPLRRALTENFCLGKPTPELLALLGLAADVKPHHVIDALLTSPIISHKSSIISPSAFVAALKKIQPRLYSISSSPDAHPGQVHLTVGAVRYDLHGRPRKGACSTFLAERALAAGKVGVFVHENKSFRPPADGATPIIMVGPGTGIAPFRAFIEHRAATKAIGPSWLFFGDQKSADDFIYREEMEAHLKSGALTRLDLAWSRNQGEKVYVQHKMLAAAAELWAWLEKGAHFYVCGDASRMAKDVDAALHQVIETAGKKSKDEAAAYVQALKATKRYARDVY